MRNHYVRAAAGGGEPAYVTDNLVFHLDAANTACYSGSGTTVNSLVNNHTNDHWGDLQWSSDSGGNTGGYFYVDGTQDTSLQFPYSTDFEAFGYSGTTVTNYSWEWWWYGDTTTSTSNNNNNLAVHYMLAPVTNDGHAISGSYGLSGTNKGNLMFYRLNNNERSYWRDSSNTNVLQENVTWSGFRWQHYVFTRSGNSTKFYRDNGTPVSHTQAAPSASNYSNTKKLNILCRYHTAYRMVGRLGVMRFYQGKALTAAEVEQNYDAEKSRYT